jgi:uncharacterized protein (DUF2147 family)
MKRTLVTSAFLLLTLLSFAQNANGKFIGVWWNEEKSSRIEVFEENGKIHGKVVWLKNNTNPDGSSPRTDYNNPDTKLQSRKLIGTRILTNLTWDKGDNEWEGGQIYDPKSGKTYSCYAVLQKDGTIYMKGYVLGMPFLGKSTIWTRYSN